MDLIFNGAQEERAATAQAFLAEACPPAIVGELERSETGFSVELWAGMVRLGWPGLALPKSAGGSGDGLAELCIVAEEMGAAALSSPLLSSVTMGALPLLWATGHDSSGPVARTWLARLVSGEAIATPAVLEGPATNEWMTPALSGRRDGDGWRLSGSKTLVAYADVADLLVVSVVLDGVGQALLLVESSAAGLSRSRLTTIGGDPMSEIRFDDVMVGGDSVLATNGDAITLLGQALDASTVVSVAYAVGLSRSALLLAADYARDREQFGRKIGSLQGVAFRCADMRGDVDACRMLAHHAAWQIDNDRPATLDVAAAKAYANQAVQRVLTNGHQVLAARGFSFESDLHFFSMRAKAFELSLGSTGFHHERVAVALGL